MPFFTSAYEKKLWLWAMAVLAAIVSSLFLGQPLARLFSNQNIQAVIFLLAMVLVGSTMVVHGLKTKPGKLELTIWLGIVAVYIMFILRLGLAERSHLMEYSVLAIFIHKAISERARQRKNIRFPALLAFGVTFLIGILDECTQLMIPDRVFDTNDIIFNGLAAAMAIGVSVFLVWVRKRFSRKGV